MKRQKCIDCNFWTNGYICKKTGAAVAECRRYPPIHFGMGWFRPLVRWPHTASEHWCGEFEEKKK